MLEAIHQVLTPYVGRLMARTAAAAHCQDLGIYSATMTRPQIDALLDKLGLGLIIFVGKEKSAAVVSSMRQAIDSLGDAR